MCSWLCRRRALASLSVGAARGADSVTQAATAEELQQAVRSRARHIEIIAHMDLGFIDAATPGGFLLSFQDGSTQSGNCTAAPQLQLEDPPLLPLLPGQCVITTDMDIWHVRFGRLWMHNLYLRHTFSVRDNGVALIESTGPFVQLWMTQMTLQGAGMYAVGTGALGLNAAGPTYLEGCKFSHLGGVVPVVYINNAPLHVVNSTFSNNNSTDNTSSVMYAAFRDGTAWLQGSALLNNTVALPLVADFQSAGYVSDTPREFYRFGRTFEDSLERPVDANIFLNGDDDWLKQVQAAVPGVTVRSEAAMDPPGTQVAIVTTAQQLQTALATVKRHIEVQAHLDFTTLDTVHGYLLGRVRSGTHTLRGNCSMPVEEASFLISGPELRTFTAGQCLIVADGHMLEMMHGRLWIDNLYLRVQPSTRNNVPQEVAQKLPLDPTFAATAAPGPLGLASNQATQPSGNTGAGSPGTTADVPPFRSTSSVNWAAISVAIVTATMTIAVACVGCYQFAQQKEQLTKELDRMRRHNELFLRQFAVLPWTQRREGGQGVVQFMRSTRTEESVAVKFFLSHAAFNAELELYKVDVLRSMMPAIRLGLSCEAEERSSRGYAWPPCIVIEKGESLQEWKAKTQPAFSTIVDALCLIAERLVQLHGSGWVHRDLKPGNILRLPGQHSWTLMDFGCAAQSGVHQ
eukprot:jgi/Ulvmu1/3379/UM158_0002.1